DPALGARHDRSAGGDHRAARADLIAEKTDGVGLGADEGDTGFRARLRELGALAEEAIAGVDRIDARLLRDVDDLVVVEGALDRGTFGDVVGLVGVPDVKHVAVDGGVYGDGHDVHFAAGAHDAKRDLAAIGDQDLFEQLPHSRAGTAMYHTSLL